MADLNKIIIQGRLTQSPEIKVAGESKVLNFCIASNKFVKKDAEHPEADFVDCVAWGGMAEFINKFFNKGSKIIVVGRLQTRVWVDKQGVSRKTSEVFVEEAFFSESKGNKQEGNINETNITPNGDDDAPF